MKTTLPHILSSAVRDNGQKLCYDNISRVLEPRQEVWEGGAFMRRKLKQFFSPSPWLTLVLVILAAILQTVVLIRNDKSAIAYFSYLFSTYALIVGVRGLVQLVKWLSDKIRNSRLSRRLHQNPLVAQYLDDPIYRTQFTLFGNVIINAVYIVLKLATGIHYRSEWLIAFAFYYLVLTVLRATLVHYIRHHKPAEDVAAEYRRSRFVGIMLLSMNLALIMIVERMVGHHESHDYPGAMIYAMAAYAFYAIILSIVQVIRFRKQGSPVIAAVKVINLTAAMVSMISLEAALIARFGDPSDSLFRAKMIGITGFVSCLVVVLLSTLMIVRATKNLHKTAD